VFSKKVDWLGAAPQALRMIPNIGSKKTIFFIEHPFHLLVFVFIQF
jgi:hypothetical protein